MDNIPSLGRILKVKRSASTKFDRRGHAVENMNRVRFIRGKLDLKTRLIGKLLQYYNTTKHLNLRKYFLTTKLVSLGL